MEDSNLVADAIIEGDWGTSIDLTSAFNHLVVHPAFRGFLAFLFQGRTYAYRAMPFGLSLSPFFFTKMMKFPITYIRNTWKVRLIVYMDDILILHQDPTFLQVATFQIVEYLQYLGLTVNVEKSELVPKQQIIFLGWLWNLQLANVVMTKEKRKEMLHACKYWEQACSNRRLVKIKRLASFLGSLNFLRLQFPRASLYMRGFYNALILALRESNQNWNATFFLSPKNRSEVRWWKRTISSNVPCQLHKLTLPEAKLVTDASGIGWGAILQIKEQQLVAWGRFSLIRSHQSSNFRELSAVLLALKSFRPILVKEGIKCLLIQSDNQTTVSILSKIRAKGTLLFPARKIFSLLTRAGIQIIVQHLPGIQNTNADSLSRLDLSGDYQLDPQTFQRGLIALHISPTIDCFSTVQNHLLPQFVTTNKSEAAMATNAFSFSWKIHVPYLHPPISMIMRCLRKIIQDQTEAIIVTPRWPGQPWWPLLQQLTVNRLDIGESSEILSPGSLMKKKNLKLPPGRMIMSVVSYKLFHQKSTDPQFSGSYKLQQPEA
jgi:hypothetical protein